MSDSISEGLKFQEFADWASKSSIEVLREWMEGVKDTEWAYRSEILYVQSLIEGLESAQNATQESLINEESEKTIGAISEQFINWASQCSIKTLQKWVEDAKHHEWAYRHEIMHVQSLIGSRVSPEILELMSIEEKKAEAADLNAKADKIYEEYLGFRRKAQQCILDITLSCSHPSDRVIQWYYIDSEIAHCTVTQCTQCGLREIGSPSFILPHENIVNYFKSKCEGPDIAISTYVRTATEEERNKALRGE